MIRTAVLIPLAAVLIATAACGSSSNDRVAERTQALRTYGHDDAQAVHVADFNDQTGPGTRTVTIPSTSGSLIVRFDCVGKAKGDGDKFVVSVSTIGHGGFNCNEIGPFAWSGGSTGTVAEPAVRKGDKVTIKVKVPDDVRWSLGVDLPDDEAAYERLVNVG